MVRTRLLFALGAQCAAITLAVRAVPPAATTQSHASQEKSFVEAADRLMQKGNYVQAALNYQRAVVQNPADLESRLRYGDALHELALVEEAYAGKDREAWESVIAYDPDHLPALRRLMNLHGEYFG